MDRLGEAVTVVERRMTQDLDARQQAFDSLQEYQRVSAICQRAETAGR